jgi:hypothetical protein
VYVCTHASAGLEARLGTLVYLTLSLELVVLTMLLNTAMYKLLALARGRPQYLMTRCVGGWVGW